MHQTFSSCMPCFSHTWRVHVLPLSSWWLNTDAHRLVKVDYCFSHHLQSGHCNPNCAATLYHDRNSLLCEVKWSEVIQENYHSKWPTLSFTWSCDVVCTTFTGTLTLAEPTFLWHSLKPWKIYKPVHSLWCILCSTLSGLWCLSSPASGAIRRLICWLWLT